MRQKQILFLLVASFLFLVFRPVKAEGPGDLPDEDDPFWNVMGSMTSPNDTANCQPAATTIFQSEGMPAAEAAAEASVMCAALANMDDEMIADMALEGVETNLFSASNWHNVENLYFERSGYGKIEFSTTINFMSYDFMNFMDNFREAMDMGRGIIGLDSDMVDDFRTLGATLTMYNIPDYDNPEILVDGKEDSGGIVSDLVYDRSDGTLTFSAAHFTTFEVTEGDEDPDINQVKARKYFNPLANKWIVKVIVKGAHFDRDTEVTLRGRSAYKIKYKSHNRVIAYFSMAKLLRSGHDKLTVRVINGNEVEKYDDKLRLSELTEYYQKL